MMFNFLTILCAIAAFTVVHADDNDKKTLDGSSTCSEFADDDSGRCTKWTHSLTLKDAPVECFPGDAIMEMDTGEYIPMSSLKIGDKILGWDAYAKKSVYTPVKAWFHRSPVKETPFVQFSTKFGTIEVSEYHNIAIETDSGEIKYVYAKDVTKDDALMTPHGSDPIKSIEIIDKVGFYAPFTDTSTLYVSSGKDRDMLFLAHSFANVQNPLRYEKMVHFAFDAAALFNSSIHNVDMDSQDEYMNPIATQLKKKFSAFVDTNVRERTYTWDTVHKDMSSGNSEVNTNLRVARKLLWKGGDMKEHNLTESGVTPSASNGGGSNNNNNNNNNNNEEDKEDQEDYEIIAMAIGAIVAITNSD